MIREPTISSLFHELFQTEPFDDDPAFLSEIKNYENAIHRLISLDSQLTHYIKTQPLLDNDQLSSIGIVTGTRRVNFTSSIQENEEGMTEFLLSTSPVSVGDIFQSVEVDIGSKAFGYDDSDQESDCITASFENEIDRKSVV